MATPEFLKTIYTTSSARCVIQRYLRLLRQKIFLLVASSLFRGRNLRRSALATRQERYTSQFSLNATRNFQAPPMTLIAAPSTR